MLHHLSPRIFHHRILMLWVMRHLFLSLMAQSEEEKLCSLTEMVKRRQWLDNLLVSARMFPDSVIFWCQAVLQNTVAEQSNPSSQSSCKNQGIIRGLEP
ncbi:hypothetical protein RHGRI_038493 [Rhododendron griersonianum]|uniref:Uncharacterized protein n=1 Tax=Rhododendron griersonianum TaxID=479676 RepID=A0AAV6HJI5_9ERIC|nr:hypothetical protein RHGRI_038493 [Rhododendron griersonianum]